MSLYRSMSCEFTSFCHGAEYRQERLRQRRSKSARKKSVQWSNDLEEVRYFVPHRSRSESIRRKFNKVKKRAENLRAFTLISDSRVKQLRRNTDCFAHNSGFQSFEEYINNGIYCLTCTQVEKLTSNKEHRLYKISMLWFRLALVLEVLAGQFLRYQLTAIGRRFVHI